MKRAAAFAVLLLLVSCTASRVQPEANITVGGAVQRAGGRPVAGNVVFLSQEGDVGDVFVTLTTIGLACAGTGPKPAICAAARRTTTDSQGRFDYKLKGRDTQGTFGQSSVLSLTTELEAKDLEVEGSSTTYRFHAQTELLDLPLRLWEPSLSARTGSFGARVTYESVPTGLLPSALRRIPVAYVIEFARGREPIWQFVSQKATPTRFDLRLLEDSTGALRVAAVVNRLDLPDLLGDEVAFVLRSGAREYSSPLDPPPSRGRPCTVHDAQSRPVPQAPCRLTDGEFGQEFRPQVCSGESGCTEPPHTEATVDLGVALPIDFIVVRGCDGTCRVETSLDARRWRSAGFFSKGQATLSPGGSRKERYVRVSGRVDTLKEVSLWSGAPRVPDASLLVLPTRFPTTSPGSGQRPGAARTIDDDDDLSVWPLVATGLLGAVVGGLVMALTRRRAARRAG